MGALDGIRVIDFGQWLAAPLAAMLLADQGAEVVHVDPPGGPRWTSPANATLNRGKTSVILDLKRNAGRAEALRLVQTADVLLENFRPGVMDRLGLGAAAMTAANPRLIYCSLPGFASDDPRAGFPAWEGVIAAASGTYRPAAGPDGGQPGFTALTISSCYGALAAAVTTVMALIARERDGLGQRIEVPLFDATFLAIGATGLLVDGRPAGGRPDDPWGGVFQCAEGGRIRLSLATPRFVRSFVETAGRQDWIARGYLEPGSLEQGSELRREQGQALLDLFATRTAEEWEALGREADVPLTRIRTSAEWLQTEHAQAAGIVVPRYDAVLGSMLQPGPAVRMGDLSPGPFPAGEGERANSPSLAAAVGAAQIDRGQGGRSALDGVGVVDLTQVLAGPTAGRTLAEFGADVIKINNPREEGAGYRWSVHRYHTDVNRGKRTVLVDLKTPEGQEILSRLVDNADVLLQNFRPDAAERLGLAYERLRARRPEIVYGTVSMYGAGGPWASLPGYEVNAQATSGMTARMGGAQPFAVNDYATGLLAAFGVGLALFQRQRTGAGQAIEAALARTATFLQTAYCQSYEGKRWDEPSGPAARGWSPLQRLYRAADAWFFLGATPSQRGTLAAVDGLAGCDGLEGAALADELERRFAARPAADWVAALTAAGLGAQRVVAVGELMRDPWVVAHGLSLTRPHWGGAAITTVGPPARLSRTPVQPGRAAAAPGADAESVLDELGLADRLAELAAKGAIALE